MLCARMGTRCVAADDQPALSWGKRGAPIGGRRAGRLLIHSARAARCTARDSCCSAAREAFNITAAGGYAGFCCGGGRFCERVSALFQLRVGGCGRRAGERRGRVCCTRNGPPASRACQLEAPSPQPKIRACAPGHSSNERRAGRDGILAWLAREGCIMPPLPASRAASRR